MRPITFTGRGNVLDVTILGDGAPRHHVTLLGQALHQFAIGQGLRLIGDDDLERAPRGWA